jgi:stage V sporulation protein S
MGHATGFSLGVSAIQAARAYGPALGWLLPFTLTDAAHLWQSLYPVLTLKREIFCSANNALQQGYPTRMADIIKVSSESKSPAVAGAIAGVIREHGRAEVQAIGAGAVNQAIKAVAIARGYLAEDGLDVICIPYFTEVVIDEQERTALRLIIEPRLVLAKPANADNV